MGDRFGAKRVLVLGLLAQAFGALGYVFVRELAAFYTVAALFGFTIAGTMPLYARSPREFSARMMGTVTAARHGRQPSAWRRVRGRRSDHGHLPS